MRYVEQGPTDAPDVTVLLHGWPDSSYSFSRVTPTLAALGHRTLSVDQRGFGGSSRPPSGYRVEDLAEDAVAFLDTLELPAVTLIGHSMGTFVARRVAQLRPERVRALVLIGTAVTANNAVLREVAALVQDLPDPVPVEFAREFQASTIHIPVPEAFFDRLVAESCTVPARVWRDVVLGLLAYADAPQLGGISRAHARAGRRGGRPVFARRAVRRGRGDPRRPTRALPRHRPLPELGTPGPWWPPTSTPSSTGPKKGTRPRSPDRSCRPPAPNRIRPWRRILDTSRPRTSDPRRPACGAPELGRRC